MESKFGATQRRGADPVTGLGWRLVVPGVVFFSVVVAAVGAEGRPGRSWYQPGWQRDLAVAGVYH